MGKADPEREPARRRDPREALLDAAERLLIHVGYAGITTRRLAHEAGVNHGLVHYYFDSMENLLAETLDRFTDALVERQRALYSAEVPFRQKWRTAMSYMDVDRESGYQKIWLELHALAFNNPELRERLALITGRWRAVVREAIGDAADEYGVDASAPTLTALTSLVETMTLGMMLERHVGVTEGHAELLAEVERRLQSLEKGGRDAGSPTRRRRPRRA